MTATITRAPHEAALRPYVALLWSSQSEGRPLGAERELMLPNGGMHVAVRLSDAPLRLYDGADGAQRRAIGHGVVGGARASAYVRDVSEAACSVGAVLRPGAARALFGVPADELAHGHTVLSDLWGDAAVVLRQRVAEETSPERRLARFEALLASQLRAAGRIRGVHPAIAHALGRFGSRARVDEVVAEVGYSHRRFVDLFRADVGLTPKLWCRVARFQEAVSRLARGLDVKVAEIAADAGYADQAHLGRELKEIAGLSPGAYRALATNGTNHVPLPGR
jgi:AraC-like DNA-binding protein